MYEIGGADQVRYRDLVNEVADRLGKSQRKLTVPVPGIPSVPAQLASLVPDRLKLPLHLLESLQYDTDVRDDGARSDFAVQPRGMREAVAAALA